MQAIRVTGQRSVEIVSAEAPRIERGDEVIVKVAAVGICGSDVHIFRGSNPLVSGPRIPGHEISGVVAELGPQVADLAVSDRVVVNPLLSCGECEVCRKGRPNACPKAACVGVQVDGAMAEYFKTTAAKVHRLPDNVADIALGAAVETFSVGAQANARARVAEGEWVFVFGAGPIGLAAALVAGARGARTIICDLDRGRLDHALRHGVGHAVEAGKEDVAARVEQITGGRMAHVAIDAVNTVDTFASLFKLVGSAGRAVVLGANAKPSPVSQFDIMKKEIDVLGSRMNNGQFPYVIELIEKGAIDPGSIISHRFPFRACRDAFDMAERRPDGYLKAVLEFQ